MKMFIRFLVFIVEMFLNVLYFIDYLIIIILSKKFPIKTYNHLSFYRVYKFYIADFVDCFSLIFFTLRGFYGIVMVYGYYFIYKPYIKRYSYEWFGYYILVYLFTWYYLITRFFVVFTYGYFYLAAVYGIFFKYRIFTLYDYLREAWLVYYHILFNLWMFDLGCWQSYYLWHYSNGSKTLFLHPYLGVSDLFYLLIIFCWILAWGVYWLDIDYEESDEYAYEKFVYMYKSFDSRPCTTFNILMQFTLYFFFLFVWLEFDSFWGVFQEFIYYRNHALIIMPDADMAMPVLYWVSTGAPGLGFTYFGSVIKCIVCAFYFLFLLLFHFVNRRLNFMYFEAITLFSIVILGVFILVTSNDFITAYIGIELQSLSCYILAAMKGNDSKSSKAGFQYYVIGSLSSVFFLLGSSFIYSNFGYVTFTELREICESIGDYNFFFIFSILLIYVSIFIKLMVVPFQMWSPNVYEGLPLIVALFFSIFPKIGMFAFLSILFLKVFVYYFSFFQIIFIICAVYSVIFSIFATAGENNIKRFLVYSSISHVGFMLFCLSLGLSIGESGFLYYLICYIVMTFGIWGIFICLSSFSRKNVVLITDLAGMFLTNHALSIGLIIVLFSMSGLPPFMGFFAKMSIFFAAMNSPLIVVAVFLIVCSVCGSYYYMRLVKSIIFDKVISWYHLAIMNYTLCIIISIICVSIGGFIIFSDMLKIFCFDYVTPMSYDFIKYICDGDIFEIKYPLHIFFGPELELVIGLAGLAPTGVVQTFTDLLY